MLSLVACHPPEEAAPGSAGLGDPLYPGLGNGGYDVSHYTLELDVDVDANFIRGEAGIEAKATQSLSAFNWTCAAWTSSRCACPTGPRPTPAAATS